MISGVVENVSSRQFGHKTLWNLKVGGAIYGCGDNRPDATEGDFVEFAATDPNAKGYRNVINGTLSKKTPTVAETAEKAPVSKPQATNWGAKDARISFQAAFNSANALVANAFQQGALKLPKDPKMQFDALKQMVLEETNQLFILYMSVDENTAEDLAMEQAEPDSRLLSTMEKRREEADPARGEWGQDE